MVEAYMLFIRAPNVRDPVGGVNVLVVVLDTDGHVQVLPDWLFMMTIDRYADGSEEVGSLNLPDQTAVDGDSVGFHRKEVPSLKRVKNAYDCP